MALSRISVLISGRGSNLAALIDAARGARFDGAITHVVCNVPDAAGIAIARERGVATTIVDHRRFAGRTDFDAALAEVVAAGEPDLVVLAGFMRVLDAGFVNRYAARLINVHPSLLPAYPGLCTHRRALADGVRIHGCTVHYVTPDVDCGPIIAQGAVPVRCDDSEATLAARVLEIEHRLLPAAVGWHVAGLLAIDDGRVRLRGAAADDGGAVIVPAPPARR
jgi:phosphoribosylglycinamide formyltransferase-1